MEIKEVKSYKVCLSIPEKTILREASKILENLQKAMDKHECEEVFAKNEYNEDICFCRDEIENVMYNLDCLFFAKEIS